MTGLDDGSAASAADPVASACLRLGWRMEELFSQFEVPERPPRAHDMTQLPGLSKLSSYDRQRLGLDQVDFVVCRVAARVGTPAAVPLNPTTDARDMLEATIQGEDGSAARREEYRAALRRLHVNLLVTLARHYADMAGRALRTMPWLLLAILLPLVVVVLVLVFIPGSAVARTATAVAAIAGTFSGIWKIVRTRVAPIAAQLERPLWGTEINTATAEAVTVPPVGTPQDPAREQALQQTAAEVSMAATQAQPSPSTGS